MRDHETVAIHLRELIGSFANEVNDLGTSDFITGLMEEHEKMAWFLRLILNNSNHAAGEIKRLMPKSAFLISLRRGRSK